MSRDWTPQESFYATSKMDDFIEMANSTKIGYKGEMFPLYTKEERDLHSKYSYLAMSQITLISWWWRKENRAPVEYLDHCIQELVEHSNVVDETVAKWFVGELDSGFYYSDWNNKILNEYLEEKFGCEK